MEELANEAYIRELNAMAGDDEEAYGFWKKLRDTAKGVAKAIIINKIAGAVGGMIG